MTGAQARLWAQLLEMARSGVIDFDELERRDPVDRDLADVRRDRENWWENHNAQATPTRR